jgi:Vacuolar protein sorting 55
LTGFSAIGSVAIPAILFHAQKIEGGALALELAAVFVLGATVVAFDFFNSSEAANYYY